MRAWHENTRASILIWSDKYIWLKFKFKSEGSVLHVNSKGGSRTRMHPKISLPHLLFKSQASGG